MPSGERNTRGRKLSRRRYINSQTQPNRNSASTQRDRISKAQPRNWSRVTRPQPQAAQRLRGGAGEMKVEIWTGRKGAGWRAHLMKELRSPASAPISPSLSPPTSRRGKGYMNRPCVRALGRLEIGGDPFPG
jgi:hypothetical protein